MTGRDVVCIAPTEWDGAWQRYHEIARRLGEAGNRVLVVENLYRASPPPPAGVRGAARLAAKAWDALRRVRLGARPVEPGLWLLSPPVPPPGRAMRLGGPLLRGALRRSLRALGMRAPVLWCAFPTPMLDQIADDLRPSLVVYDCASAFAADPYVDRAVVAAEARLLRRADLVFTDSRGLWERHARSHPSCHWVPTGVDVARFASVEPRTRRDRPVVGYAGTLHAWLDAGLCAALAEARPGWTFVYVGPRRARADLGRLERLRNVRMPGAVPHAALPEALARFDVAWIPYRLAEFTRYVFPTKLLEYLAAGLPVASTDLPEVRPFAPPVRLGDGPDGMGAAIDAALREGANGRGRRLAARYDWRAQIDAIHERLDAALAAGRRA